MASRNTKRFDSFSLKLCLLACFYLPFGAQAQQEETYEVFRVIEDLRVTGTITTDGTLGRIGNDNFIRWNLNIGGTTFTQDDSILVILGVRGPMATDQDILIDMSAVPGGNEAFQICGNNICNLNSPEWQIGPSGTLTDPMTGLPFPCSADMSCGGIEILDNVDPDRRQVFYTTPQLLPIASKSLFLDGFETPPAD
ncbi:MAG: hypothetical protein AAGA23_17225 [Pseudomonadota bacterium]